jgi:two-component system LytT family sensor kinase
MRQTLYNFWFKGIKPKGNHVLWWAIFIAYEVSISGILAGRLSPLMDYLIFYFINITLFYCHAYFMQYALGKIFTSLWRLPLLIIAELTVYILLITLADRLINGPSPQAKSFDWKFMAATVWRGISFILYGTGYYLVMAYIREKNRLHQEEIEIQVLKNQLLIAQKDFLRAQINPHLLFNTLSFIKYAAKKDPEASDEAIMVLSDIMSFALNQDNVDYIILSEELKQVENMIRLNQLRYDKRLCLEYRSTITDAGMAIIPIVLLTLTENVFKHGNLLMKEYPACIEIDCNKSSLRYYSSNLPLEMRAFDTEENKRGLQNIEDRLKAYYQDKCRFSYGINGKMFEVELLVTF